MTYPGTYRYTKEHEWVDVTDGVGRIGITFHAQKELGDIVYVDLPKVGTVITQGRPIGSVESVKAASEVYAPLTGEVVEANGALADHPARVNPDPAGAGWFFKIRSGFSTQVSA